MTATLKMTHKAIRAEVRRGTYDIVVDGQRAGSVDMNATIEIPVGPGRHTLQVRSGRNSSRTETLEAAESQTVSFRCTGKSFLPIFLASFVVPSLALQLRRETDDRSVSRHRHGRFQPGNRRRTDATKPGSMSRQDGCEERTLPRRAL
jgi:hypothetical protein